VIVPEYFSGKESYEDWIDQFKSIAEINQWNKEQKLIWPKICLTGRAPMAYKNFLLLYVYPLRMWQRPYKRNLIQRTIEILYIAEFQTIHKNKLARIWEVLRVLVDKVYPFLDDNTQQQLTLEKCLSQLDNEQMAFCVKQGKPKIIEAAASATLECESYLPMVRPPVGAVATVQVHPKDKNSDFMDMMNHVDKLEENTLKWSNSRREILVQRPVNQIAQG